MLEIEVGQTMTSFGCPASLGTLWDGLERNGVDEVLFVAKESAVDVRSLRASCLIADIAELAGRTVAIAALDPIVRCVSLIWLDGLCSRMLLLPSDFGGEKLSAVCRSAGVDAIITDRAVGDDNLPAVPLVVDQGYYRRPLSDASGAKSLPRPLSTEWVLVTSGTTGEPKLVAHTLKTLTRSTRIASGRSVTARWGLLYDVFRFAGLQVYLQALLGGGTLITVDDSLPLSCQIAFLARQQCNSLSATPTRWRQIIMTAAAKDLPLQRVTLGGEIADDKILGQLARAYPKAAIRHIYASTEAGVGFSVNDGRAGFPASFLESLPVGVEIDVRGDRLFLRPHVRGQRYLSGQHLEEDDGFIDTGDIVVREGDRFLFLGRASGSINVGGNKLLPEEVEAVLLRHPFVVMARVYAIPSSITGALVAADVVTDGTITNEEESKRDILKYCRKLLPPYKLPITLKIVDDLAVSEAGKILRRHA